MVDVEGAPHHSGSHEALQCQVKGEHYHEHGGCLVRSAVTERDDHGQPATEKGAKIGPNSLMP